jgi:hypothetical protein
MDGISLVGKRAIGNSNKLKPAAFVSPAVRYNLCTIVFVSMGEAKGSVVELDNKGKFMFITKHSKSLSDVASIVADNETLVIPGNSESLVCIK